MRKTNQEVYKINRREIERETLRERGHSGRISYHDCTKTVEASKPNTNKWVINLSNTPLTED